MEFNLTAFLVIWHVVKQHCQTTQTIAPNKLILLFEACYTSHYQQFTPPFDIPDSWEWVELMDCCHIAGRIGFRGYTKDDLVSEDNGAITLSPSNIVNGSMKYDSCTYISWHKYYESPEIQVREKDILLVKTGSSYGKCALVECLPKEATINPQYVVLKHIAISHEYLTYVLQSNYAKERYEQFVIGTAIPTFTQEKLGNLSIPLPPFYEQVRIVKIIKKYLNLIGILDSDIQLLSNEISYAKSKILDLAMQGKLVPQNPTDEPAADMLRRINPKAKILTDNPHYPQLPDNWVLTRIKDVFEINPKNRVSDDIQAGFVPMASIHDGYSDKFHYEVKQWGEIKSGFTHFADGDIAVAKISPCLENRKSMILRDLPNGIGAGTTELLIFRSKILIPEFSLLFFKSCNFIKCCTGTFNGVVGQQRVGKTIVEDIHIPIPPLNIQRTIVQRVQEWFNCLDNIIVSLSN